MTGDFFRFSCEISGCRVTGYCQHNCGIGKDRRLLMEVGKVTGKVNATGFRCLTGCG